MCLRPACNGAGVIGEDGTCDICFLPPADGSAEDSEIGLGCPRPDCLGGTIGEDLTCDVCFRVIPKPITASELPGDAAAAAPPWHRTPWDSAGTEFQPLVLPNAPADRALARSELGIDVLAIPSVPTRSPEALLLADPVVAEKDRVCPVSTCRTPVGRADGTRPGHVEGRCPQCGAEYSFRPPLRPGETVGQYRIRGCVGQGGQGWVYLAYDENLDDEPVALKGMRDSANYHTLAEEKRTLIAVRHPDIVDIRNFVVRLDPVSQTPDSYIVLEFLDGVTLAEMADAAGGALPVGEAIAYVLGVLPALGYLHDSGLVYGDFKPPNVMQVGNRMKLVDMGAVARIGADRRGQSWVTRGYAAPESPAKGPSIAGDLYSVGRTLAALTTRFDMGGRYEYSLPEPNAEPTFARHESFYRFLRKATAAEPEHRFTSAGQMARQLAGVLREVVALDAEPGQGRPGSAPSTLFTLERGVLSTGLHEPVKPAAVARALPLPRPDDTDPATGPLSALSATQPHELVRELGTAPPTAEVAFRLVTANIALGDVAAAREALAGLEARDTLARLDWRRVWYSGLVDLACGDAAAAWREFAAVRDNLPGELAPKLALAACAEVLGGLSLARHYYRSVWRTDDAFVGAAFGVARAYRLDDTSEGDYPVTVLESIPERLHHYATARIEALRLRLDHPDIGTKGLREAADGLQHLELSEDDEQYLRLKAHLLETARRLITGRAEPAAEAVLGVALDDRALGFELEHVYLALRRHAPNRRARVALVRAAHAARPRTRW
jgi:serine/threonine-protein kinase PknG